MPPFFDDDHNGYFVIKFSLQWMETKNFVSFGLTSRTRVTRAPDSVEISVLDRSHFE